jgi:hypothetical protein
LIISNQQLILGIVAIHAKTKRVTKCANSVDLIITQQQIILDIVVIHAKAKQIVEHANTVHLVIILHPRILDIVLNHVKIGPIVDQILNVKHRINIPILHIINKTKDYFFITKHHQSVSPKVSNNWDI